MCVQMNILSINVTATLFKFADAIKNRLLVKSKANAQGRGNCLYQLSSSIKLYLHWKRDVMTLADLVF